MKKQISAVLVLMLALAQLASAGPVSLAGTYIGPAKARRTQYSTGAPEVVKSTITLTINANNTFTWSDSELGDVSGTGVFGSNSGSLSFTSGFTFVAALHFSNGKIKGTSTSVGADNSGFFQEAKFALKKQ